MGILGSLFSGKDIIKSAENVALEYIETAKETAEAKALMVKTLDPNGIMRRDISKFTSRAYGVYLVSLVVLIVMHFFGYGDQESSKGAIQALTELFLPITGAWTAIVSASFGVNYANTKFNPGGNDGRGNTG